VSLAGQAPTAAKPSAASTAATKKWNPPRLPDGQPDLEGVWDFSTLTPLQRPGQFEGQDVLGEEEREQLQQQVQQRQAVISDPNAPTPPADAFGSYDAFWAEQAKTFTDRTSLIVDPPDGRIPPMLPAAQQLRAARAKKADAQDKSGIYDTWEDLPPYTRCISRPFPRISHAYNLGVQVVQAPGQVMIYYESMHDARVIPTDGRPHLAQNMRQWNGTSRGRWEGNTLVVETINFSEKSDFQGVPQDKMRMTERFTRVAPNTLNYEVTIEDPTTWTKPWTFVLPWNKADDYGMFEFACAEGNIQMSTIMRGAREKEKVLAAEGAKSGR
jgi:hypothetical protein